MHYINFKKVYLNIAGKVPYIRNAGVSELNSIKIKKKMNLSEVSGLLWSFFYNLAKVGYYIISLIMISFLLFFLLQ